MTRSLKRLTVRVGVAILIVNMAFLFFDPGGLRADERLTTILDGILKRYGDLPGLAVTYKREIITKSREMLGDEMKADLASGEIHFKPPGYIKIIQEKPRSETVTSDGETLWWYIPEKDLVYEYPSSRLGRELTLLGDIFRGLSRVEESFDVMQSDLGDPKEYHLKMIPNPPWEEIDHINLSVDRDSFDIREVEIYNFLGSITRFTLSDLSVQRGLNRDYFRFVVPEGVKVIKEE